MPEGIVYILINEAMPGYAKVGKTATTVEQRMKEFDTSGVPLPFECFYAARVADMDMAEKRLHDAYKSWRVRPRREFFRVSPEEIASALQMAEGEEVTPRADVVEDAGGSSGLEPSQRTSQRLQLQDGRHFTGRDPDIHQRLVRHLHRKRQQTS